MILFARLFFLLRRAYRRLIMHLFKRLFDNFGSNSIFHPFDYYSFKNTSIGKDVYIGPGAVMLSSDAKITIGNKVIMGPSVTLITGDHNTSEIGEYMFDIKNKLPENDLPIVIKDDVWIGSGVTILKGITIGTGSIIAAGAIVTRDTPPFSISAGVPAKVLKYRWEGDELKKHIDLIAKKKSKS